MKTSSKVLICVFSIILIAGGGWWLYKKNIIKNETAGMGDNSNKYNQMKGGGRRNRVTPALTDKVILNDVPVIITALGTVNANKQVTVHTRVSGLLQSINFNEGGLVKAGQVIARIDARPFRAVLDGAMGQLAKDTAQLNSARADLERYQKLFAENSIARQQVDTQASLVKQLEGVISSDNANINAAKLNLSFTNVTAPIGGRIGLRQVDAGNMVNTSDMNGIAVITEVQPIAASFSVPQENLAPLVNSAEKAKQNHEFIIIEALDRDNKTVIDSGKLIAVDNQSDTSTGSIKIKAEFSNKTNQLFPGQFVNIRIILETLKNVPTVMQSAVQHGTSGSFVYLVTNDKKAKLQKVTTGVLFNDRIVIQDGVKENDIAVIDGIDKLRDGVPINIANNNNDDNHASVQNKNNIDNKDENNAGRKHHHKHDPNNEENNK